MTDFGLWVFACTILHHHIATPWLALRFGLDLGAGLRAVLSCGSLIWRCSLLACLAGAVACPPLSATFARTPPHRPEREKRGEPPFFTHCRLALFFARPVPPDLSSQSALRSAPCPLLLSPPSTLHLLHIVNTAKKPKPTPLSLLSSATLFISLPFAFYQFLNQHVRLSCLLAAVRLSNFLFPLFFTLDSPFFVVFPFPPFHGRNRTLQRLRL